MTEKQLKKSCGNIYEEGNKMRNFFNITENYIFEWNDLRAGITVLNVLIIMTFRLSISWFGLTIAAIGIIKDLTRDKRINGLVMHSANLILNVYFLNLYLAGI